jgi:hypothetical protein
MYKSLRGLCQIGQSCLDRAPLIMRGERRKALATKKNKHEVEQMKSEMHAFPISTSPFILSFHAMST